MLVTRRAVLGSSLGALALAGGVRAKERTEFGVNCFDLFNAPFLSGLRKRDPRPRVEALAKSGIPFVRFAASPFWPVQWRKAVRSYNRTFVTLDAVTEALQEHSMQAVPSLIWYPPGLSDALGERASAWGDSKSRAWAEADRYMSAIIERYSHSKAIKFWEFGNEFDSFANMPEAEKWFPKVSVEAGTFPSRSPEDRFTLNDIRYVYERFANIVTKLDPQRKISSGSLGPRRQIMNHIAGSGGLDTVAQYKEGLSLLMPDPMNVLSVHIYPDSKRRFREEGTSFLDVLQAAREVADARGATLFVGEFGVQTGSANERNDFEEMMQAIVDARADYAAIWAYEFNMDKSWSVEPSGPGAWKFDAIAEANRR